MLSRKELKAFYDRFGARQDGQAFYEDAAFHGLVAHGDFGRARAVFEFGCGTGRLARDLLAGVLPEAATYTGYDLSDTMVALTRERIRGFGERAVVRRTDGEVRLSLPDGYADRFVSTYVLDLLPAEDISCLLEEAHRVLTPSGLLCLTALTEGITPASRVIIGIWKCVHALRPGLVGGCRPLLLRDYLSTSRWESRYHDVVVAYGIPSEVLIARKRGC